MISICITTHQHPLQADFLSRLLLNIYAQDYSSADTEIVISDDSEDDAVVSLCEGLPHVRYVRNANRGKSSINMNNAINHAQGEVIKPMFSDDYFVEVDSLSKMVAALRESLRKTGFWDNVVARARDGKAEIAYGHHRLAALKEEFGPNHKVEINIRKLTDETMIQIMARENMEEWETSSSVIQETIRAVVEAYGDGLITLPPMGSKRESVIRYAPSFTTNPPEEGGASRLHPYIVQQCRNRLC